MTQNPNAISRALGPTDTARFIRQYSIGGGDYTANRNKWLDETVMADIITDAEKMDTEFLKNKK